MCVLLPRAYYSAHDLSNSFAHLTIRARIHHVSSTGRELLATGHNGAHIRRKLSVLAFVDTGKASVLQRVGASRHSWPNSRFARHRAPPVEPHEALGFGWLRFSFVSLCTRKHSYFSKWVYCHGDALHCALNVEGIASHYSKKWTMYTYQCLSPRPTILLWLIGTIHDGAAQQSIEDKDQTRK